MIKPQVERSDTFTKPLVERSDTDQSQNRSEKRSDRSEKLHRRRSSDQTTDQTDQTVGDQKTPGPFIEGRGSVAATASKGSTMTRNRTSAKAAGARFEREVADYLAETVDDRIDRRVKTGNADKGDLGGIRIRTHRVVAECKNHARTDLAGWYAQAETEATNDGAPLGVVIHKRRNVAKPERQWVTMTLGDFAWLLREANA